VTINELDQSGVTRCLKDRDDFTKNFNRFLDQPMWQTPHAQQLQKLRETLLITPGQGLIKLHGTCSTPLKPLEIQQIPHEHKCDRPHRQFGGEAKALSILESFLSQRGCDYSTGISSPNTSWTSCSRLSPYLTWGNISLRYVILMTKQKQLELREAKKQNKGAPANSWLRSLASFQSRMHWRSHFIQKLESQPSIEEQDQCQAFSHLRRQPSDFNEQYFEAWCHGRVGYPFVDACMRCLIQCGWINFRMRAMLVSFATYNLWLDWKKIAPHLARLFLGLRARHPVSEIICYNCLTNNNLTHTRFTCELVCYIATRNFKCKLAQQALMP
jgi:deoxyribodipyrimidine photo-lyase